MLLAEHRRGRAALVAALALVAVGAAAVPAYAVTASSTRVVTLRTVPATPGVRIRSDGLLVRTDAQGLATVTLRGSEQPEVLTTLLPSGVQARFGGLFDGRRTIGLSLYTRARLRYVHRDGRPIPLREVQQAVLQSSTGVRVVVRGAVTPWLQASRVVRGRNGLRSTPIQYSLESVTVGGGDVVHRAQWRFRPLHTRELKVPLLLYALRFTSSDALFKTPVGAAVLLTRPDGSTTRLPLHRGVAEATGLPRGSYRVKVESAGYSFEHPVALSRDQVVDMQVVSLVDVVVILGALLAVAFALVLIGRPQLRRRLVPGRRQVSARR